MNDGWRMEMKFAPSRNAYHLVVRKSDVYCSIMVDRDQSPEDFRKSTVKAVEMAMEELENDEADTTWPLNHEQLALLLKEAGCPSPGHHIARLRSLARGERVRLSYHATCRVLVGDVSQIERRGGP